MSFAIKFLCLPFHLSLNTVSSGFDLMSHPCWAVSAVSVKVILLLLSTFVKPFWKMYVLCCVVYHPRPKKCMISVACQLLLSNVWFMLLVILCWAMYDFCCLSSSAEQCMIYVACYLLLSNVLFMLLVILCWIMYVLCCILFPTEQCMCVCCLYLLLNNVALCCFSFSRE